ncbi:sigma-54 interaction domain-containing protein [Desulfocicer niacini]
MAEHTLNRYWETVVKTIQDGVMIVDTQGKIVFVNRAFEKITGYASQDIVDRPCTVLNCNVCRVSRLGEHQKWCILFREGKLHHKQCKIMTKDGRSLHVVKNASVLREPDGRVTGAVETLTDITQIVKRDRQIEGFRRELALKDSFHGMIGISSGMQRVFDLVANAARSDAPVIVYGESGTGKEMVANAIHEMGDRQKAPYIKVNCSALNESLLESELFGHVRGAFTGAHRDRMGKFEAAGEGDLFLDEIGDLSPAIQVKLLRVLEERVVEKVGDNRPVAIHARIITATNRDLKQLVDAGQLREDFYYRINVIPICLPPLRERREDIPLLAECFFRRIRLKSGRDEVRGISPGAFECLGTYAWPGNVRELKSAFEYAFVTCREGTIQPEHLPRHIVVTEGETPFHASFVSLEGRDLDSIKRQRLVHALESTGGNRTETAKLLGISRTSVWNQMKRYQVVVPPRGV